MRTRSRAVVLSLSLALAVGGAGTESAAGLSSATGDPKPAVLGKSGSGAIGGAPVSTPPPKRPPAPR